MRLPWRAAAGILNWHFRIAALLAAMFLPISLLADGWRDTLLMAVVVAPALFLIWCGGKLSASDAGGLLTSPLYKEIVGAALMFIGWVLLAYFLGATVIASLF